jgi:sugar phosphate isomerase/epimerase
MRKYLLLPFLTLSVSLVLAQQPAPVGLQLYSFRDAFKKDVPGTLAQVRAMGFREIEVAGTYGLPTADFRKLLDQNGLKAIGYGAGFEKLANDVPQVIADAKTFGAKYVVCAWIPHTGDIFTQADADNAIDVFNTAGKLLADNGLSLCYHTHGYEFQPFQAGIGALTSGTSGPKAGGTYFDYLAENLDPKFVNFEMDVFWVSQPGKDPIALLQQYGKRFVLMHLKDRQPGTPPSMTGHTDVESNVTLGAGDIGIAAIVRQARKSGVKHFFIEDESSRAMQQMPASIAFMRTVK